MFTTDDEKLPPNYKIGEIPKFQTIGDVRNWFESAADQLDENDLVGMSQLRMLCAQETRKIYARWEAEFSRPASPEDKAEIEEDFRMIGILSPDPNPK